MDKIDKRIAIIGLGYVGWPLAQTFAEKYDVVGLDRNAKRINELLQGVDRNSQSKVEVPSNLVLTCQEADISECDIFILTVPTPVDKAKRPNLEPLFSATRMVAKYIKKGSIVIYESTVYPDCTEEECVPILIEVSGLKYNEDFFCGYSPERISPGDAVHTLKTIVKVTSGSTPEIAVIIDQLYQSVIPAGTYLAPSIRVAEAAKAIENAQRDLNISFMNELALLFNKMNLDTSDVLLAASTKWNFLNFKPGLVGGHCIGVDPYYLTYRAQQKDYLPEVILSGRRINEGMSAFVATNLMKLMREKNVPVDGARVLLLGITYKEHCPDTRNSGVVSVYKEMINFGLRVDVFDPWADPDEVLEKHSISLVATPEGRYDAIILAVAHREFLKIDLDELRSSKSVVYDLKSILPREWVDKRL